MTTTARFVVEYWVPISTPVENRDFSVRRVMRRQSEQLEVIFADDEAKSVFLTRWHEAVIRQGGRVISCVEMVTP